MGESQEVVYATVSFQVVNSIDPTFPCPADGVPYAVRGHLAAPAAALEAPDPPATLYLHGVGLTESTWTFDSIPGGNHLLEMAELEQVSISIERVGWDPPFYPHGESALPAEATSASRERLDEHLPRGGRPYGGSALADGHGSLGGKHRAGSKERRTTSRDGTSSRLAPK